MATLADLYEHLNSLTKHWFYDKSEMDTFLAGKASSTHVHGNVTNDGKVGTTANKPLITGTGGAITTGSFEGTATNIKMNGTQAVGTQNTFARGDHVHPTDTSRAPKDHSSTATTYGVGDSTKYGHLKLDTTITDGGANPVTGDAIYDALAGKAASSHGHASSEITDSSSYSHLGTSANATQATINSAVNTKIGALLAVELIEVTTNKGTASASTMNKLYLVAESTAETNDAYEIFVTVRTGTSGNYSYAWEKVDTARIDLSGYATTSHTHGNITTDGKIGTTSGKIVTTGTGGALQASDSITKSMISDFPSTMTPASHTHGDITNDGKLGSTANLPVITTTGGKLATGNFESTATNIKMNGTRAVGTQNTFARGDHVHPTDTSRAPTDHSSTATTYGVGDSTKYGHLKLDTTITDGGANPVTGDAIYDALALKANTSSLAPVATSGSYLDLIDKPAATESVYATMGDSLEQYYIFSKYTNDGELCLGRLEDIGAVELNTLTNAVVTDDTVTYTATVTDIDDDVVSGVYVEFLEDDEIVGSGITDSNGVATFSKVYDESVICDVTAKIGTNEDDLTMFVKDKENLLNFNQWSCGETNRTSSDFIFKDCLYEVTTEKAYIGYKSLKLTRINESNYSRVSIFCNISSGGVYSWSGEIFNNSNESILLFYSEYINNTESKVISVNFHPTSSWESFRLSGEISNEASQLKLMIYCTNMTYIDDLKLIKEST